MDYERKYNEALERAKNYYDGHHTDVSPKAMLEYIFPELKESEDERIRKELINFFSKGAECDSSTNGIKDRNIIAWLEKQGEHANFRNKIQIGDKVTRNEAGVLVNLSQLNRVAKIDEKQGEKTPTWSEEDELMIQDAIHWIQEFRKSDRCKDENDMQNSVTCENWLKSIKPNHWKPSEEQIEILDMVLSNESMDDNVARILRELKEQIEKL